MPYLPSYVRFGQIPHCNRSDAMQQQPALSLLLDDAKALGIPWILAITNKFSVSAHQQRAAIDAVLKAYQASPSFIEVINSCPYVLPSAGSTLSWSEIEEISKERISPQKLIFAPINFLRRPLQRKAPILPVDGVTAFSQLAHCLLLSKEEASGQLKFSLIKYKDAVSRKATIVKSRAILTGSDNRARRTVTRRNISCTGLPGTHPFVIMKI
ncbi:hypothetical protein RJ641_029991 [Dillenia turbinata]|uniref:Uncharacterized protein n=1 Tax=Dillenia turbinata TaxID=194707 RepID=A0AAN8VUG6_9MAGN